MSKHVNTCQLTNLAMSEPFLLRRNFEDLVEFGFLLCVVGVVLVSEPTRQCLIRDVLQLGDIEVQFLQVSMLLVVRHHDHPQDVVQ